MKHFALPFAAALALFSLALIAAGCGPLVTVGNSCESRSQCVSGLECVLGAPGGFCTRGCLEEGSTTECPGGTTCIYFGGSQLECSAFCETSADCRINYECAPAGGTTAAKACRPEGVTR